MMSITGLCPQAENRGAPDMLDRRVTSSEHRTEDDGLLVDRRGHSGS